MVFTQPKLQKAEFWVVMPKLRLLLMDLDYYCNVCVKKEITVFHIETCKCHLTVDCFSQAEIDMMSRYINNRYIDNGKEALIVCKQGDSEFIRVGVPYKEFSLK